MTLLAAFIAALKFVSGVIMFFGFVISLILILFLGLGDLKYSKHKTLQFFGNILLLFVWLTLAIFVCSNMEKWYDREWFQKSPTTNTLVIER